MQRDSAAELKKEASDSSMGDGADNKHATWSLPLTSEKEVPFSKSGAAAAEHVEGRPTSKSV
jgi:hypothetical protein